MVLREQKGIRLARQTQWDGMRCEKSATQKKRGPERFTPQVLLLKKPEKMH